MSSISRGRDSLKEKVRIGDGRHISAGRGARFKDGSLIKERVKDRRKTDNLKTRRGRGNRDAAHHRSSITERGESGQANQPERKKACSCAL